LDLWLCLRSNLFGTLGTAILEWMLAGISLSASGCSSFTVKKLDAAG